VNDRQSAGGAAAQASLGKVVLASNNAGKLREFAALLGAAGIELIPQGTLNVPEAEEPYPTFVENALTKARYAQLAGGPKSDAANNARLVEQLRGEADRRAYYFCALVLVRHADDPEPLIAEGRWPGQIIDVPRGAHGFGYDPHFFLPELDATAAELDPAVKNTSSHRAIALRQLLARLTEEA
jgi:XTP/dITP diphosphohydrolase